MNETQEKKTTKMGHATKKEISRIDEAQKSCIFAASTGKNELVGKNSVGAVEQCNHVKK